MGHKCSIERQKPAQKRRRRSRAKFAQPRCEQLEERLALALFTVQNPLSFSGLSNNNNVAVADLNKDGLGDAILTNFGSDYSAGAGSTITILYGRATGGFTRVNLSTGGKNVSFVSIGDINGDSWPDAVVTNQNQHNTGSVSVFRNDGAGNLVLSGTPFSTFSYGPSWVALSDVTGDGILDVIASSDGKDNGAGGIVGNNVTIFQGNANAGHGNFTFSSTPITTLAPSSQFAPASVAIADFDGDGLKDIAAAVPSSPLAFGQPQQEGSIHFFRGTGSGSFATPTQVGSGGAVPVDIHAADLNGDGKLDLVVANAGDSNATPEFKGNAVGVLLNISSGPGNVGFGAATSLIDNTHGTFAVAVDDFNLDGKVDIAAVNYGGLSGSPAAFVSIYMGNGTGTFTPGSPATYDTRTGSSGGQYLAVGDLDGNGTPDLIVAHASNLVGVLLNTTVRGPRVLASQFAYVNAPQRVTFTFDQDVSASLGLNDITIQRLGDGTITPASLSFDVNTKTWTVNFTGILADGNYRATLSASGITNSGGTPMNAEYVLDFFFLKGDLNHDRQVSIADFITLASNFNKSPATYTDGDLNYDGIVSISDFIDLASNFNASLAQPTAAVAPQASAADSISSSIDSSDPLGLAIISNKKRHHRRRQTRGRR